MCHSSESRPPQLAQPGSIRESGPLTLTSADGTTFSALYAVPGEPNGINIVILPDIRGTHPYYVALADRFAQAGYTTAVIDYYGRTAGPGPRDDAFPWRDHMPSVQPDKVQDDVTAALEHLKQFNQGPTFTVGFCFGGGQSWRLAAGSLDLAGVIGFYGLPGLVKDVLPAIHTPMLLLLAGDDVATSQEDFTVFTDELTAEGKTFDAHVYEGAPHSFFDGAYEQWQDACDDAWGRLITFIERHGALVTV